MKEYYDLMKVVDPHQHMPKGIRAHLFDGLRYQELNNDTFVQWTVGDHLAEYEASLEEEEDLDSEESDPDDLEYEEDDEDYEEDDIDRDYEDSLEHLAKVDEWLLKHDFKKGEEIIVLFWW